MSWLDIELRLSPPAMMSMGHILCGSWSLQHLRPLFFLFSVSYTASLELHPDSLKHFLRPKANILRNSKQTFCLKTMVPFYVKNSSYADDASDNGKLVQIVQTFIENLIHFSFRINLSYSISDNYTMTRLTVK